MELPSSEALSEAPIALGHDTSIIRHFLDLFQTSVPTVAALSVSSYAQLIELGDRFQAPMVYDVVTTAILVRLDTSPPNAGFAWEVFKFAARIDDFGLAQAAVRRLDRPDKLLLTGPSHIFDEVPSRYLHALFSSSLRLVEENKHDWNAVKREKWVPQDPEEAAARFEIKFMKVSRGFERFRTTVLMIQKG